MIDFDEFQLLDYYNSHTGASPDTDCGDARNGKNRTLFGVLRTASLLLGASIAANRMRAQA